MAADQLDFAQLLNSLLSPHNEVRQAAEVSSNHLSIQFINLCIKFASIIEKCGFEIGRKIVLGEVEREKYICNCGPLVMRVGRHQQRGFRR